MAAANDNGSLRPPILMAQKIIERSNTGATFSLVPTTHTLYRPRTLFYLRLGTRIGEDDTHTEKTERPNEPTRLTSGQGTTTLTTKHNHNTTKKHTQTHTQSRSRPGRVGVLSDNLRSGRTFCFSSTSVSPLVSGMYMLWILRIAATLRCASSRSSAQHHHHHRTKQHRKKK